jgi:beta-lactam-binding protein with PASTA domain
MKKRIIAFLLMMLMLVSAVGCGKDNSSTESEPQQTPSESTAPQASVDPDEYINENGTIKMPDLTNMPLEEARALLKSLGLRSKFGEEFDKTGKINVGCVIKTDYAPGEEV